MKKLFLLVLFLATACLPAHAAFGVKCDAGMWDGVNYRTTPDRSSFESQPDGVTLPETIYVIDAATMSAVMLDGRTETVADIQHAFRDEYVVIGYTYNNVRYTDTIYMDGNVISMYSKHFFGPTASIFQRKCTIIAG